jgi:transposase
MGNNAIAKITNRSKSTISGILNQAKIAGFDSYELVEILSEQELKEELDKNGSGIPTNKNFNRDLPDWEQVHRENQRKGVTLKLLYQEYKNSVQNPVGRSWFYDRYKKYVKNSKATMTFEHKAGEKLFVDYSGLTFKIYNTHDQVAFEAEVFVGCLGFSDAIFCGISKSQGLEDWCDLHVKCFEYFGGVPTMVIPDNLKSGVTSPCRYEPTINRTYHKLAEHYQIAVIPARVKKARDKAKVEKAVQTIQREILAPLRNHRFYSFTDACSAIKDKLDELNNRKLQKEPFSRWEKFHEVEKDCLRTLPQYPFEIFEWRKATVAIDYHVEVEKKRYSVPYENLGEQVEVRHNNKLVEVYKGNKRLASHKKIHNQYHRFSTIPEHMPSHHQKYAEWNPGRIISWANEYGNDVKIFAQRLLASLKLPEQGYKRIQGVMSLSNSYPKEDLNKACKWACNNNSYSYKTVKTWLENNSQKLTSKKKSEIIEHKNLRSKAEFK